MHHRDEPADERPDFECTGHGEGSFFPDAEPRREAPPPVQAEFPGRDKGREFSVTGGWQ